MWKWQECPCCAGRGKILPPEALRSLRVARSVSLSELSRSSGVSVTYLSDVERGRRNAGPHIQKIYSGFLPRLRAKRGES